MTDLTIIQFMISGALLLGLISIGFLVVHLRKGIEQLHSDQAQLHINILEQERQIMHEKQERRSDILCLKDCLKRRATKTDLEKSVGQLISEVEVLREMKEENTIIFQRLRHWDSLGYIKEKVI